MKHFFWRCAYSLLIGFGSLWELCDKSLPQAPSGICLLYVQVNVWGTEVRLKCYGLGFGTSPLFIDGNINPQADRDTDVKPSGRGSIGKVEALTKGAYRVLPAKLLPCGNRSHQSAIRKLSGDPDGSSAPSQTSRCQTARNQHLFIRLPVCGA